MVASPDNLVWPQKKSWFMLTAIEYVEPAYKASIAAKIRNQLGELGLWVVLRSPSSFSTTSFFFISLLLVYPLNCLYLKNLFIYVPIQTFWAW